MTKQSKYERDAERTRETLLKRGVSEDEIFTLICEEENRRIKEADDAGVVIVSVPEVIMKRLNT